MSLWRCQNERCSTDAHGRLIFDFESSEPVCPKCGTDARATAGVIVRLKLMHYDPPHPKIARRGKGHAACDPHTKVMGTDTVGFTGDPAVVNCPRCRATDEWRDAAGEERAGVPPEADFVVGMERGVVTRS